LGKKCKSLIVSHPGAPAGFSPQVCHRLKRNFRAGNLGFHGNLKPLALFRHNWHVYSKRHFGDAEQAVRYLGHYTHRVAISNHRLVS
jgi:hypothetical protein